MKAIIICLSNQAARRRAIDEVNRVFAEEKLGTIQVVLQNAGTKSAKQRGLQHLWYRDIVRSGMGGKYEEGEDILDVYVKYRWGVRIMTPTRPFLAEAFTEYSAKHGQDPERMMWWTAQNIHTEEMTVNEMAQFLTAIHHHYVVLHSFPLTDPDEYQWKGLLDMEAA